MCDLACRAMSTVRPGLTQAAPHEKPAQGQETEVLKVMRLTGLWSRPLSMRAKVMRERRQQVHMSSSGACVVVVHICAASATVTRVRGVKPSLCTSLHQQSSCKQVCVVSLSGRWCQ